MKYLRLPVGSYQANCCLVFDEQKNAVVIDPGDEAPRILRVIQEHSLHVKVILLTHAHFDHILAVTAIQEATDTPLWVHEAEEPALADTRLSMVSFPYTLTADRLLHDGESVTVDELSFTVLHTPGHTAGSVCYRCENTLFSGDTLFAGGMGRTDFPGGSSRLLWNSLEKLSHLPPHLTVVAGHGEETTIGREFGTR
ncbi:MAG: MBL fold metallo-hydrolase [Clostridia bacterium]|nr:MBL fold metallo-hydrolase [Clostridia bacterium]